MSKSIVKLFGLCIGLFIFLIILNTIVFGLDSFKANLVKIAALVVVGFNLLMILNRHQLKSKSISHFSAFKEGFTDFNHIIMDTVNFVLLSIVYLFGVGPITIIARLSGKRFLDLNPKGSDKSYWKDNRLSKKPIEEYTRSF